MALKLTLEGKSATVLMFCPPMGYRRCHQMTLVLSCVTPDFVLQVSDRRLTTPIGGVVNDDANKAVLLFHAMVFAYTGLAEIEGQRTDVWLTHTMRTAQSIPEAISLVADSATEAFKSVPLAYRMHAFAGVGWGRFDRDGPLEPLYAKVSNFYDAQGRQLPNAQPSFIATVSRLGGERYGLAAVGQSLQQDEVIRLRRYVRRACAKEPRPEAVGRLLATQVRQVAARNRAVGAGLLVNCLPRPTEQGTVTLKAGNPSLKSDTFLYVPAGTSEGWEYPPQVILPGGTVLIDAAVKNTGTFVQMTNDDAGNNKDE